MSCYNEGFGLFTVNVSKNNRLLNGMSSKGNQRKWCKDGNYIKLNTLNCREDVSECLVSSLLSCTNIDYYVVYNGCHIVEDGVYRGLGTYCRDFKIGWEEVSIGNLLDVNLMPYNATRGEVQDLLYDTVGYMCKEYLDSILCLDAITMNDDRHFNNISLLGKGGRYKPAPIFDNGCSCLVDMNCYPMGNSLESLLRAVYAKPFYTGYEKQVSGCTPIRINTNEFFNSVKVYSPVAVRALEVIKYRLKELEGVAWIEGK